MSWDGTSRRILSAVLALAALPAFALRPSHAAGAGPITVELNKLESQDKRCTAYLVVDNPSDTTLSVLRLDVIVFRSDGIIDRRLALDLGPVRAAKKTVRIFPLDALPCDTIGSFLVNDVIECTDTAGPVADCLSRLKLSSRGAVPLSQ